MGQTAKITIKKRTRKKKKNNAKGKATKKKGWFTLFRFDFSYEEYKRFIDVCPFTDEELQVLEMRRKGKSVIEIAFALNLSDRTVERRIKSIKKKIGKEIIWYPPKYWRKFGRKLSLFRRFFMLL